MKYEGKTFKELHEAHDPEVDLNHFSLEMHGPIYVLEEGLDNPKDQSELGISLSNNSIMGYQPEWVEIIILTDCRVWRIGVFADNDYLFQVILPMNEFSLETDQWLTEYLDENQFLTRLHTRSNEKAY